MADKDDAAAGEGPSVTPVIAMSGAPTFPFGPPGSTPDDPAGRFGARLAPLGDRLGLTRLGAMLTSVEPGKRAFPFHNHLANDELFVILEGTGELRLGDATHPVKAGDVVGCPRGGPDTAHQLVNTGTAVLVYLAVSSTNDPDIAEYPDSGKFIALAVAPGPDYLHAHLRHVAKRDDGRDYWEGEA
ncbi:MAG: cupin domain-containing protein [Pseudomonadota bacterium]